MSPRLRRVMLYQFVAVIFNAFLMAGLSMLLVDWLAPWLLAESNAGNLTATILRWMSVLGFTIVGSKWLNNISLVLINMVVYGGDLEAAAQEATEATAGATQQLPENFAQTPDKLQVLSFTIVDKPEAPYARYQDADIFEWLDVEDDTGTIRRMQFEGTVDMKRGLPAVLDAGTILIPPGILYKLQPAQ